MCISTASTAADITFNATHISHLHHPPAAARISLGRVLAGCWASSHDERVLRGGADEGAVGGGERQEQEENQHQHQHRPARPRSLLLHSRNNHLPLPCAKSACSAHFRRALPLSEYVWLSIAQPTCIWWRHSRHTWQGSTVKHSRIAPRHVWPTVWTGRRSRAW